MKEQSDVGGNPIYEDYNELAVYNVFQWFSQVVDWDGHVHSGFPRDLFSNSLKSVEKIFVGEGGGVITLPKIMAICERRDPCLKVVWKV